MSQILLLLDHTENQRRLSDWLSGRYEVLAADGEQPLNQPFDLCLVDGTALDQRWEEMLARKKAEAPTFLPILLVTSRPDVTLASRHLGQSVDDLIISPVEEVELQARVESLLQTRRFSLESNCIQKVMQVREEMVQNISHELRTPLTMILGHTELLREGFFGPIAARQQPSIATIDAQGQRLLNLVNRLLLLQTIASRTLNRASHDLAAWLTQVVASWKPRATEAGILLLLDLTLPLPSIEVDLGLLDEAITNLLENAFKFSPKGGQVTVRASQHEGGVCLQVADQGIGISPDQMHLVFDRFHQGDGSITRQFGGVGIGLSLCKAIAEAHGGRICAESAGMGQGSTFTIFLPAA